MEMLVVFGTLALLVLAAGIIFFVILYQRRVIEHQIQLKNINEQKELELIQASIRSEEEERQRIASELHDDVVATLSSARLFLYKNPGAQYNDAIINQSKALLDESIAKIRDISHKLQPLSLQHLGLEASLQSLAETINKSGVISVQFRCDFKLNKISDHAELAAYRICQELINNIFKHSGATQIMLEAENEDKSIIIRLKHNGTGLSQETFEEQIFKKGSTGLKNIVNRIKSVNAEIVFYRSEEQLFITEVRIPYITQAKT